MSVCVVIWPCGDRYGIESETGRTACSVLGIECSRGLKFSVWENKTAFQRLKKHLWNSKTSKSSKKHLWNCVPEVRISPLEHSVPEVEITVQEQNAYKRRRLLTFALALFQRSLIIIGSDLWNKKRGGTESRGYSVPEVQKSTFGTIKQKRPSA